MTDEKTRYHFDNIFFEAPIRYGDIYLIQIGRRYCEPSSVIGAHAHSNWFELTLVTAGSGSVLTNGEARAVHPGDIYLSFPCDIHEIKADDNDKLEYDYFSFFCEDGEWKRALERIIDDYHAAQSRCFRDDRISVLVGYALSEFTARAEYSDRVLECIFHQIIAYLIRDFSELRPESANVSEAQVLCYQLMNFIDTHIYSIGGSEDITEKFNYNYSYLSTLFKKTTGKKLSEYYRDRKLETARVLLSENKKKIYEIAQLLHYSTPFAFSKAFRAKYGISPKRLQSGGAK